MDRERKRSGNDGAKERDGKVLENEHRKEGKIRGKGMGLRGRK